MIEIQQSGNKNIAEVTQTTIDKDGVKETTTETFIDDNGNTQVIISNDGKSKAVINQIGNNNRVVIKQTSHS
ncbi:hypothetical protein P1X15_31570 [Runella sp. MFBS21]|uniref:hypothetical protein n=1 Tax=Runella TaxID=105 RepID=UPI0003F5CA60|nr:MULTISPECIES: hypothetical protein [Runella]MDF7822196.1 hypothetical protein [Runella sp. MFBS21]